MSEFKPVRRCVCLNVTFEEMVAAGIHSVEHAGETFGAGTRCGTCRPYIERMTVTGETEFEVLELRRETGAQ